MIQLHEDVNFHYETMRAVGTTPYFGSDMMEIFEIMPKIKAGDFESWYTEWQGLAQRVLSTVDERQEHKYSPVTLRNVYFRASHYFYVADFFLHNSKYYNDQRLEESFFLWRKYFNKANALLPIPGERIEIQTDGFAIPAMFFRASSATPSNPRPTVIIGGGFESSMEETFHVFGFGALEREYNVILYEGPGQRSVLRQGHGFIAQWERAVTPLIDYIFTHAKTSLSYINPSALGLVGMSLGGYLSARAAAFEPRLAAVMCIDGVYDVLEAFLAILPPSCKTAYSTHNEETFNTAFASACESPTSPTGLRWFADDLKYTFNTSSAYAAFQIAEGMNLRGLCSKIKMPAFIGDARADMWFLGQPPVVAREIGENAVLFPFTEDLGAQLHCQSGALVYLNQVMYEFFKGVVGV